MPENGQQSCQVWARRGEGKSQEHFLTKEFLPSSAQDTTMPDLLDRNDDLREYFFGHWKGLGGFVR